MARRGDICKDFDCSLFRYFLKKRFKHIKTFASRMGISERLVYAWLAGKHKPTYKNLFKIAEVLGVSPRQLVTRHGRRILNEWQLKLSQHLFDDGSKGVGELETRKTVDADGNPVTITIERKIDREAIDLTARLGYFDMAFDDTEAEQTPAEKYYDDLTDEVPEAYKNLDEAEA